MKNFARAVLVAIAALMPFAALAQIGPDAGLSVGQTPVQGGSSGQCLYILSGKLQSQACSGGSGGTVTSVSVTTANGVSGSVANPTSTPAISLTLGAITPTTVNGNTITTGTGTLTLAAGKTLTDTSAVGASILLGATGGGFSAYGGASACSSNNFVTALSAAGATTCGSSTISGVSLGSNLATLSYGTHLTNSAGASTYNGSAASTVATDATAANTASTIMARDGSGQVAATTFTGSLAGNATTATSATSSTTATTATNATNIGITDDTTTNATMDILWATSNSGNLPAKVTSTKLTFNPSTGALSSTSFTGAGTGLTGTAASLTAGNASVAPAGTLTGATLASGVTASSLTSLGGGTVGTAAFKATGTSGNTVPLLDGANTWSTTQTFTVAPVFTNQSTSRTALGLGTAATAATGTSGTTIPFLDGTNTWTNLQTYSSGVNIAGGSFGAGTIYKSATQGLSVALQTGSVNDFSLFTPGGAAIMQVATGANGVAFLGTLSSVLGSTAQTNVVCYNSVTGLFTYQTWATGCSVSSARFKQNIHEISNARALEIAINLIPVSYQYTAEADLGAERHVGFTAEQVETVDRSLVGYEADGVTPRAVKYQELAPIFAGAIQALRAENDNLRACNANWKCRIFGIAN